MNFDSFYFFLYSLENLCSDISELFFFKKKWKHFMQKWYLSLIEDKRITLIYIIFLYVKFFWKLFLCPNLKDFLMFVGDIFLLRWSYFEQLALVVKLLVRLWVSKLFVVCSFIWYIFFFNYDLFLRSFVRTILWVLLFFFNIFKLRFSFYRYILTGKQFTLRCWCMGSIKETWNVILILSYDLISVYIASFKNGIEFKSSLTRKFLIIVEVLFLFKTLRNMRSFEYLVFVDSYICLS